MSSVMCRSISISMAVVELKLPWDLFCELDELASLSWLGMMPVDSLVTAEKGLRKARSTASLILVSWAVSQSTRNRAIMAVTKSA